MASTRAGPPAAASATRARHARRAPVSAHAAVSVPPSRSVSAQHVRSRPPGQNRRRGPERTAGSGAEQIDPAARARDERRRRTVRGGCDRGLTAGAAQDGGPPPAAAHAARQHGTARLAPRREGVAPAVHGHHRRPAHDGAPAQAHGGRHPGRCRAGRQDRVLRAPPPRRRDHDHAARGRRRDAEGDERPRAAQRHAGDAEAAAGVGEGDHQPRAARASVRPDGGDGAPGPVGGERAGHHLRGRAREFLLIGGGARAGDPGRARARNLVLRRGGRGRSRRRDAHHRGGGEAAAEPGGQRFCW